MQSHSEAVWRLLGHCATYPRGHGRQDGRDRLAAARHGGVSPELRANSGESLVDEIRRNRAAQEYLARDNPTHTARVVGEAVEAEAASSAPDTAERAEKRRRMRAETDQLEIQNLHACAAALANIGESMDDAMLWSYRDRLSNLMRGGAAADHQDTIDAGGFLAQTRGMAASLVEKLRIPFGRIAARRQ